MLIGILLFHFVLICAVLGNTDQEDAQIAMDELQSIMERWNEPEFDVGDDIVTSEVRKIAKDYGFGLDRVLLDFGFMKGLSEIFSSGGGKKWATFNFGYQLACYQGREGSLISKLLWAQLTYDGYGCYCGGGWYYGNYLDATDRCCKVHDKCFQALRDKFKVESGCHAYTTPYTVQCCKKKKITKCTDGGPSAERAMCECDQAMARCVAKRRAKRTYNKAYYNNRTECNDVVGKYRKNLTPWEILKSCKHYYKPRVTFPITRRSQGSCPAVEKKKFW